MLPPPLQAVRCAIVSVAESRTQETDESGRLLCSRLEEAGHLIADYRIMRDKPVDLRQHIDALVKAGGAQVIICNGGTGITPRDHTYDLIESLLEKRLDGFGRIFHYLAFKDMGAPAFLLRLTAGVYKGCILISLPGSPACVKLALEKLILPELVQMTMLAGNGRGSSRTGVH
jgi:molybdopterin adenylyltransferase